MANNDKNSSFGSATGGGSSSGGSGPSSGSGTSGSGSSSGYGSGSGSSGTGSSSTGSGSGSGSPSGGFGTGNAGSGAGSRSGSTASSTPSSGALSSTSRSGSDEASGNHGIFDMLEKIGVSQAQIDSVRGSFQDANVEEALEKARTYVNDQISKARDYAKQNPGVVLGGLAGLVIGAGLLTAAMKKKD